MSNQEMNYPKERNLDGVYVRVKRSDTYFSLCFTDLTTDEQQAFLERLDMGGLQRMSLILADFFRSMGDQLDITRENSVEDYAE